ncbi:hypothetical protein Clacol_003598 [Clathrus columnatus]|uniref:OTU domain-containing protein n=1 Tax=Clathrus columnatus TaxID=1419009 RepID=A0AAV5A3Z4_9AGAM|nr:hypothetical protein Clacol_003598 [Clathrus columnatus]
MGPSRRSQKPAIVPARTTRNRSRHYKSKLITDTAQSTLQLTNQLRALGLYAAPTLGDGNCLFRALSDQLWGSSNSHLKLRTEVCDWMASQRERYEGFVDEDRTFDTHLKLMRLSGTYGGHLELSAFAHLKRRNVKVIQPGLVYVIEWNCGWLSDAGGGGGGSTSTSSPLVGPDVDDGCLNERDKRRLRREKKKTNKYEKKVAPVEVEEEAEQHSAIYVAYHDWEHFSSVRNLTGPHTGLPLVVERPPPKGYEDPSSPTVSNTRLKGNAKAQKRLSVTPSSLPASTTTTVTVPILHEPLVLSATPSASTSRSSSVSELDVTHLLTPAQIPLPLSRSISPPTSVSDDVVFSPPASEISAPSSQVTHVSTTSISSSLENQLSPKTVTVGSILAATIHNGRSPKRTFDETEDRGASEPNDGSNEDGRCTPSSLKRHKLRSSSRSEASAHQQIVSTVQVDVEQGMTDVEDDNNNSTPSLSSDNSSQEDSSSNSSSTPPPSFVRTLRSNSLLKKAVTSEYVTTVARQRTPVKRQQRRAAVIATQYINETVLSKKASRAARATAQEIEMTDRSTRVLRSASSKSKASANSSRTSTINEEWQKNGSGRVDVRGFRELRI